MIRAAAGPVAAIQRARDGVRRSAMRKRLEAVVLGKLTQAPASLEEHGVDVAGVIDEVTAGLPAESVEVRRLIAALKNSGAIDGMIERLESRNVHQRASAARTVGALRMYEAVPCVAPLLASRERHVADASARALGRIGGTQSAGALVHAIQRKGINRRMVAELARGAPDQFIEGTLAEPLKPGLRPALVLAAGLRRRRTATPHLIALVERGSRRERVISCRALGWIGATTAIPVITGALTDRDWKLRMSAAKALGALRASGSRFELRYLAADRNPRVRTAALQALRQIDRSVGSSKGAVVGA
jgi:HEAT repeat protein